MKGRTICICVGIGVVVALAPSGASAQGFFSAIVERVEKIEKRLQSLERSQTRDTRKLQSLLSKISPELDSSMVALRLRTDRLAEHLEKLENQVSNLLQQSISDPTTSESVNGNVIMPGQPQTVDGPNLVSPYGAVGGSLAEATHGAEDNKRDATRTRVQPAESVTGAGNERVAIRMLATELRALIEELRDVIEQPPAQRSTAEAHVEPASARQLNEVKVKFGGQVRPRFEFHDPAVGGGPTFTSMRARAHVSATLGKDVGVFLQFQDVRLWGEETNTLTDFRADNFDLHQGYAELRKIGGSKLSVRLGRQAISLGEQRLIGAVEWTQQGRVFDGVRTTADYEAGRVDLMWIKLAETRAASFDKNAYLMGAYAQLDRAWDATLDLYALYNRVSGGPGTDQMTLGLRWAGERSTIFYRFEGSYQTGERGGLTVSAYMLGASVGTSLARGKGRITLWYDYLSGDDDLTDEKVKVFDTLFATNHKFYGYADLFLNIPVHTKGRGLQDFAIKTSVSPRKGIKIGLDLHSFFLAEKSGLVSGRLAEEADFTLSYRYSPNVSFIWGFSYVTARNGFAAIGRPKENVSFGYVMSNVTF
jgi:hypothetical protein